MSYADDLLEVLASRGADVDELDRAFARFAPRNWDGDRGAAWRRTVPTRIQVEQVLALHPLDRRRMCFLRTGEVNLSRIDEVNPKMFTGLVGKGRDELEQLFLSMERDLPQSEARTYVHAAFNLQRHFANLTARTLPEAQEPERLDEAFLHEFCAVLDDRAFGFGLPHGARSYLLRYAFLHFDFDFPGSDPFRRILEDFMNDFRRPQPGPRRVEPERVRELFGMGMDEIGSMSRREFARVFRKKAMAMHPDKGGDHDAFVELLDTYKRIVSSKPERS